VTVDEKAPRIGKTREKVAKSPPAMMDNVLFTALSTPVLDLLKDITPDHLYVGTAYAKDEGGRG